MYSSSCNSPFFGLIPASFHYLSTSWCPRGRMGSKWARKGPKRSKLLELSYIAIVKSWTIRLASVELAKKVHLQTVCPAAAWPSPQLLLQTMPPDQLVFSYRPAALVRLVFPYWPACCGSVHVSWSPGGASKQGQTASGPSQAPPTHCLNVDKLLSQRQTSL